MTGADLLLHPIRLRIVRAFLGDRALTTGELAAELSDVPVASLYRHVALLSKAGVLHVVAERRVRAAVERTYMLRPQAAQIQPAEVEAMSPVQHLGAFLAYVAGMLTDAEHYLMTATPDPLRDGASYRMGAMWLTHAEFVDLARDLAAVLQPRLAYPPAEGRRRRTLYTVVVPAPGPPPGRSGPPAGAPAGRAQNAPAAKVETAKVAKVETAEARGALVASDKGSGGRKGVLG